MIPEILLCGGLFSHLPQTTPFDLIKTTQSATKECASEASFRATFSNDSLSTSLYAGYNFNLKDWLYAHLSVSDQGAKVALVEKNVGGIVSIGPKTLKANLAGMTNHGWGGSLSWKVQNDTTQVGAKTIVARGFRPGSGSNFYIESEATRRIDNPKITAGIDGGVFYGGLATIGDADINVFAAAYKALTGDACGVTFKPMLYSRKLAISGGIPITAERKERKGKIKWSYSVEVKKFF